MSPFSVVVEPGSELSTALAPVLASLPDDFTEAPLRGDVAVVDGRRSDWPDHVTAALGRARGVLLRHPALPSAPSAAQDVAELASRAREHGVPVVVDRRWSGAPGVSAFAGTFAAEVATSTSATVLLEEDDPQRTSGDGLLDALGLARATGATAAHVDRLHQRPGSWSASGRTADGAALHLQGITTSAGAGARLTVTSADAWASVHVPDASSAAPATARLADESGERLLPTEFEPASRAAWRRLHGRVTGSGSDPGDELAALAADIALAGTSTV